MTRGLGFLGGLLGFVAISAGVAVTGVAAPPLPPSSYTPPPPDEGAPSTFVLADDHGAVIVEPAPDHVSLVGVRRGGGVAWRATAPARTAALACAPCPTLLAVTPMRRLELVDGGGARPVEAPSAPHPFSGLENRPLWATRTDADTVRAWVPRPGDIQASLLAPDISLPLPASVEWSAQVAASVDGRHLLVVSNVGGLRLGERRIVEAGTDGVVLDKTVGVVLDSLEAETTAGGCISDDGSRVAVLLPAGGGLRVLSGRWGAAMSAASVPIRPASAVTAAPGCAFTPAGLVVAGVLGGEPASGEPPSDEPVDVGVWYRSGGNGHLASVRAPAADQVLVCGRGDVVVLGGGTAVVHPAPGRARTFAADSAGCTPGGDVWIQHDRELRWLARRS